ncbi:HPP family protein [Tunturiibacter lichenicola]|uniref:HPP family protein n=1 Tax=Tunturiibacter lichenicola TaxID=2051959 RepID=UPI0021B42BF0|nr:HPP family protein [Edaphobacter lichenicola]
MKQAVLERKTVQTVAETLVIVFIGTISWTAHSTGIVLLLFPELAALSHDVITRPRGKWASQPWRLILTPTLTAIIGLYLTRHLSYGALNIALIVALSLICIKLMKSTIAPAISAGALPMVLGERSWLYPLAIFLGLALLVIVLLLWRRFGVRNDHPTRSDAEHSELVDALEALPHDRFWAIGLMTFVLILGAAAQITNLRFLLFPPLIVMAYELFGHPEIPGWMKRPALFPIVCLLTASIGLVAHHALHANFIAAMVTVLCSVVILRLFDVHMPPALAVGLLPFVMTSPDYRFPLSVLLGTVALTLYFFAYKRLRTTYGTNAALIALPHRTMSETQQHNFILKSK